MSRTAKALSSLLVLIVIAASFATAAIGRNGLERGAVADLAGCSQIGGEFHPEAWRAPAESFSGYHCIFPAGGTTGAGLTVGRQRAAEQRCERVHGGSYTLIAVAAYSGYACTWPRTR